MNTNKTKKELIMNKLNNKRKSIINDFKFKNEKKRISENKPIKNIEEAYLKLHLISYKFFLPNSLNLENLFDNLVNVAWTNQGPIEIDEIEKRVELAKKMGGQEGIDVQHGRGKLTIRERLDLFCDRSSFQEIGRLAGAATYEDEELSEFRPSNTVIGLCELNGRKVVVNGRDITVRGGSAEAAVGNKGGHAQNLARDWRLP